MAASVSTIGAIKGTLASLNGSGAVASSVPNSSAFFGSSLKKVHQESPTSARFPPEALRLWRSMRTSRQIRTDAKGWPMISQMTSKISQEGRVFCSF
ncbi:ribulose bisphosphate carboxylase/oxygenase activase 2, chloroplastic-like isoform X2 [Arachis ipaensis]|uniref:ribulose bisphosphate carboxylase/oxygenase activase 2, chloroplastic-like isoform X2 n=1 Tax=Arachis ipaensis TaxID=130454 RepID=UPI000A2B023D|nr:ribulose bisphosphate carboxylase/oxygenase activase 2, chloroplastic-like isoform X2 [Arachis ipaensis]